MSISWLEGGKFFYWGYSCPSLPSGLYRDTGTPLKWTSDHGPDWSFPIPSKLHMARIPFITSCPYLSQFPLLIPAPHISCLFLKLTNMFMARILILQNAPSPRRLGIPWPSCSSKLQHPFNKSCVMALTPVILTLWRPWQRCCWVRFAGQWAPDQRKRRHTRVEQDAQHPL